MLLHDSRNEDGVKSLFQEVHELYIKVCCLIPSQNVLLTLICLAYVCVVGCPHSGCQVRGFIELDRI